MEPVRQGQKEHKEGRWIQAMGRESQLSGRGTITASTVYT